MGSVWEAAHQSWGGSGRALCGPGAGTEGLRQRLSVPGKSQQAGSESVFYLCFHFLFHFIYLPFVLFVHFLLTEASVKDIVALNSTLGMLLLFFLSI